MYLRDLSIFQYHEMEVANDFIVSMANRVKYSVIVDEEDPLFAFDETPFKTIMEKHPDHVVFRWMKKCPNIPHFIMSGSMSIVECYDVKPKQWLLSMTDAVDVVSIRTLAFDALVEQSYNPWTKESHTEEYKPTSYEARSFVENNYHNIEKDAYIKTYVTDNYVELGRLTALRFLEWVYLNPDGVISLPTGKSPEFFISWTEEYLNNWKKYSMEMSDYGIHCRPDMKRLTFFQMDEYVPMDPDHEKSFNRFVREQYVRRLGLDPNKVHLLNGNDFSDMDNSRKLCQDYEDLIKSHGGIGFFLGGIGPDGHIAFNISGSEKDSMTRVLIPNRPTLAAASEDLGGITKVREKHVVTIGLETITWNPDATIIIMAAGDQKSKIVHDTVFCNKFDPFYPGSAFALNPNARFYVTKSITDKWHAKPTTSAITFRPDLNHLNGLTVLHTSPHHDDMELGYYPLAVRMLEHCDNKFAYLTRGYTSVTDKMLLEILSVMAKLTDEAHEYEAPLIQTYSTVNAKQDWTSERLPLAKRLAWKIKFECLTSGFDSLQDYVKNIRDMIREGKHGAMDKDIQLLKSWIREFEAESMWYSRGVKTEDIHHLHLPFYSDKTFPTYPDKQDIEPIIYLLTEIQPDIVTVCLDPEGSGPGTHFKCLLAMYKAMETYYTLGCYTKRPRIWGYRNVWSRFTINDAPLTGFQVSAGEALSFESEFKRNYKSQTDAEFPNPYTPLPFQRIATNTWRKQLVKYGDKETWPYYGTILIKEMSLRLFRNYMEPLVKAIDDSPHN